MCLSRTAFKRDFATIKAKRYLQYMIANYYLKPNGKPMVYIFQDRVSNILIGMPFSRGFPLFEKVNQLLINIKSSGFIEDIYGKMENYATRVFTRAQQVKQNAVGLGLQELKGIFVLLIVGWLLSLTVFITECIAKTRKCKNKMNKVKF